MKFLKAVNYISALANDNITCHLRIQSLDIKQSFLYSNSKTIPRFIRHQTILSENGIVYDYSDMLKLQSLTSMNNTVFTTMHDLNELSYRDFIRIIKHNIAVIYHIKELQRSDELISIINQL